MNSDIAHVQDVRFHRTWDTLVALEKQWWLWGGFGTTMCRYASPGFNTSFKSGFYKVDYAMVFSKLAIVMHELALYKLFASN